MESVGRLMISVIMLTYNREKLVGRMIECILAQTYRDFEFIIVNNGSTDLSGEVAEQYAAKDSRIRVIHRTRGSIGAGRNTGLDVALGDYIAFVDDDDTCEPDFLEFLWRLATDNHADVSICGAADKAFDEKRIMTAEEALVELMWRKRYNMGFPTKLFSKRLGRLIRFPENDRYDDISQMHRLLAGAQCVAYHGLSKYTVNRHENNNSAWTTNHSLITPEILGEYLRAYRERTVWLSELFPESKAVWEYFEWSFMISMVEKVTRLKLSGCDKELIILKHELNMHRDVFLNCPYILDFEKEWMGKYA